MLLSYICLCNIPCILARDFSDHGCRVVFEQSDLNVGKTLMDVRISHPRQADLTRSCTLGTKTFSKDRNKIDFFNRFFIAKRSGAKSVMVELMNILNSSVLRVACFSI
jgi:hypothetical protein